MHGDTGAMGGWIYIVKRLVHAERHDDLLAAKEREKSLLSRKRGPDT